jgi:hypothetical protein
MVCVTVVQLNVPLAESNVVCLCVRVCESREGIRPVHCLLNLSIFMCWKEVEPFGLISYHANGGSTYN